MPSALETARFGQWLLCTRFAQSVAEPKLLGRTRDTVEVYLKHAQGHLWRVLYPRMQMMPESEWRAYCWALVNQKFHGVFTDEGRWAWVARAEAEARAYVTAKGGGLAEADAAAAVARERVIDGIQAATSQPLQREHAMLCDVYLMQDLLLTEDAQVSCSAHIAECARVL